MSDDKHLRSVTAMLLVSIICLYWVDMSLSISAITAIKDVTSMASTAYKPHTSHHPTVNHARNTLR